MALEQIGNTAGDGVAFIVAAGIVYEIIAANCSSPQTAELNAQARSDTLMKWVKLGVVQSAFFVGAAATYDKKHAKPILAGGIIAGGFMYLLYAHALKSGLASGQPATETYPTPGP